jgi:hypothetical protein
MKTHITAFKVQVVYAITSTSIFQVNVFQFTLHVQLDKFIYRVGALGLFLPIQTLLIVRLIPYLSTELV